MIFEKQGRVACGSRPVAHHAVSKGKCLLLFVGHKTDVIKPRIRTKGYIILKHYKMPLFILEVYRSCPVEAAVLRFDTCHSDAAAGLLNVGQRGRERSLCCILAPHTQKDSLRLLLYAGNISENFFF